MTLLDLGLPARRFRIDAVDVSARRLAIARRGGLLGQRVPRYPTSSYRSAIFREHPAGLRARPLESARRSEFIQASVLDPRLLEGSPPYDVVFCRNLLIYLGAPARARVLAAIDRLLATDGVLFIGHADRLDWAGGRAEVHARLATRAALPIEGARGRTMLGVDRLDRARTAAADRWP